MSVSLTSAASRSAMARPWLLCVDLQREFITPNRPLCAANADSVAEACRAVLAAARRANWPVAHIHTHRPGALFGPASPFTRPIPGLEPWTSEPLFFRPGLSIFSSPEILGLALSDPDAEFFVIGFSASGSCLASLFAGFDMGIHLALVEDAIGAAGDTAPSLSAMAEIIDPLCATLCSADLIRYMERAHADGR
jgi:nicotinamidase-related amidase